MKKLYSAENRLLVFHIKNLLEAEGVSTELKNEFAGGGIGDIAPLDTWIELWVDDESFDDAGNKLNGIINGLENPSKKTIVCKHCAEESDGHFKVCWNCGESLSK